MRVTETRLPGVLLIEPDVHRDGRGFFVETYHIDRYRECGIAAPFVQDNHSRSIQGTLRGLHLQVQRPQGKLIHVIEGEIFDVAVDVRRGSPAFGRWVAVNLSADNFRQVYVPPGFAHGFCTLKPDTVINYKCTAYYSAEHDKGVAWDDPQIGIEWPALADPDTLSPKDRSQPRLADLPEYFRYEAQSGVSSPCA